VKRWKGEKVKRRYLKRRKVKGGMVKRKYVKRWKVKERRKGNMKR
jgi:hypothetical protein